MGNTKQQERLARAVAIVVAAVLAVAAACMATSAGHAVASQDGGKLKGIWASVQAGLTLEEALQKEGIMKVTRENAPHWLAEEVMPLDDMEQAIADERFEVLWFTRDGSADDASSYVRGCLEGRGWTTCGIGEDGFETFVKTEGVCSWVMAECIQAGGEAAIVLRIRHT